MRLINLGVDRAIAITILNRSWGLIAGPTTLIFIVAYLTPTEQGFYFAFAGILGLQVFFELGLGFVVMQTVSHLMAKQKLSANKVVGGEVEIGRLGRLLTDIVYWYGIVCTAFILIVLLAGYWFLQKTPNNEIVNWELAWLMTVPIFGLSILTNAILSFLEGMGLVAKVALVRLVQALLCYVSLWLMLFYGYKLLALVVFHGINLLVALIWILGNRGSLLWDLIQKRGSPGTINWRIDMWPFQWRIAVSWMAGYCATQLITLILFAKIGAVGAGRFGLTLAALSAIATGASAWVTTKAPRFGNLAANRQFSELWNFYYQAYKGAILVGAFGAVIFIITVASLNILKYTVADRFLSIWAVTALAAATVVGIKVSAEASFLRAFRREPYMRLSITTGLTQVTLAVILTEFNDVTWVAIGYAAVTTGIGLILAKALFLRLRDQYLNG